MFTFFAPLSIGVNVSKRFGVVMTYSIFLGSNDNKYYTVNFFFFFFDLISFLKQQIIIKMVNEKSIFFFTFIVMNVMTFHWIPDLFSITSIHIYPHLTPLNECFVLRPERRRQNQTFGSRRISKISDDRQCRHCYKYQCIHFV